ncbi:E3 ubiquitin-protein ligase PUB22-like [Cucumis melo]|uniref:U-box domain-containing protein n=1 Tax=Cucumis melo TaxID=3656 RepID=A0A1S3BNV9_CUCME|nr:E3 ubiquitin-protein ligase PUB22-like [Cucumis melo]
MAEIEVPSDFLCPISLQIMRDPVTISTGITYDRECIKKWLSSCKNQPLICPVSKQALSSVDLTPNHTLGRVIQGWCSLHERHGVEQIPTPKDEIDRGDAVKSILKEAMKSPRSSRLECLKRLKSIVAENESNKIYLQNVESMLFLTSILFEDEGEDEDVMVEEAIEIITNINSPATILKNLLTQNPQLIDTLISIITSTKSPKSRASTIAFLCSLYTISDQTHKTFTKDILFIQLTRALMDQISTKPALQILLRLAPFGRNRIKAIKNGVVFHVVELLLNSSNGRECELAMAVLDRLCECAEGRAELLQHGGGMAVFGRKILRVSNLGNEKAVRILYNVCKNNVGNCGVAEEMVEVGVVAKLCLMLQVGGNLKTRERVKEILHLLQCVSRGTKCVVVPSGFDRF